MMEKIRNEKYTKIYYQKKKNYFSLIVVLVYYPCCFGLKLMVSFVNVVELICFDAVKVNAMRRVIGMPFQLYSLLHGLPLLLPLSSLLVPLCPPQSHHANDLYNPIFERHMNIALK